MESAGIAAKLGTPRRSVAPGGYPPAGAKAPMLTEEQERVLLEHLPIVRFLARRIHERLPSMWILKIWFRPEWWG